MGGLGRPEWASDQEFTIDGVPYLSTEGKLSPEQRQRRRPEQMTVLKPRVVVERYEALIDAIKPRRIVELGIYRGGSAALLAQLARPEKLVVLDIRRDCEPLDDFIDAQELQGVVSPHYGVDQADVEHLDQIMASEFGGEKVDLIIDDASHLEPQTRVSFNRLFPHVRPGGAYVIEDWSWAHHGYAHEQAGYQGVTPPSLLTTELVLASACRPRVIAAVEVDFYWTNVRRGPADLHSGRFDLSAQFDPVGRQMIDRLSEVRSL
jgi:predicted O-methyltransferase YrrM